MSAADPYQQALIDLARAGHGAGSLPAPDGSALRDSPLCGDRVRMQVRLEGGRVSALAHDVKGCLLCQAAAAMLGLHGVGLDEAGLRAARQGIAAGLAGGEAPPGWPEFALFEPVRPMRNRHGCVLLPFDALIGAIEDAGGKPPAA